MSGPCYVDDDNNGIVYLCVYYEIEYYLFIVKNAKETLFFYINVKKKHNRLMNDNWP